VRTSDAEQELAERAAGEAGVPRVRRVQAGEAKPHVAWQAGEAKPHVAWRENKAGQRMAERASGRSEVTTGASGRGEVVSGWSGNGLADEIEVSQMTSARRKARIDSSRQLRVEMTKDP
jgi:hypothetical protein